MADHRAILAVSEAVIRLLRSSVGDRFDTELEFQVYTSRDFNNPMSNGVSLFMYRIFPQAVHRSPAGRINLNGRRMQTMLPVEAHFLLTVWGQQASLQHALAGWMMRTLEDTPTLPAAVLNAAAPGAFRSDESVDICLAELRTEDLFRIWDVLGQNVYQLSVPYLARIIHLESVHEIAGDTDDVVQERTHGIGRLVSPAQLGEP